MTPVEDWVYKEERSLLSFPHSQSLLYSSTHNLNKSKLRNSPHVLPLLTHLAGILLLVYVQCP